MPENVRAFYQDFTLADMSETKRGLGWVPMREPVEAVRGYAKSAWADFNCTGWFSGNAQKGGAGLIAQPLSWLRAILTGEVDSAAIGFTPGGGISV
jgi:hypothetical protein